MRTVISILVLCLMYQTVSSAADKKTIVATRAHQQVVIDGKLDEPDWVLASEVCDFTELKPNPGIVSEIQSSVRVLYDDDGIYIGAELEEPHMDHLGNLLFERDNLDDSKKIDWFAVMIDCYQNGLSGFAFVVSASGVQADLKFNGHIGDAAWDAVWDSQVTHHENGWTCEVKIPYSALRFPDQEEQRWGIQFGRRSHHRQEESYWNPVSPDIPGSDQRRLRYNSSRAAIILHVFRLS